jgi:hypothetical protein
MTIFRTAYDTQACQGFVLRHVEDGLKKADVMGYLRQAQHGQYFEVVGATAIELAIPGFAHPFAIKSDERERLVVDMRPYGRWDNSQNTFQIRNAPGAKFARSRGDLNHFWLTQNPEILRDLSPLPLALYADFVSKNIAKRFALDAREEQNLQVLAAWFYLSCFTNEGELTERDRARFVQTIARATYVPAEQVFSITDKIPGAIKHVVEMCKLAPEVVDSVRLTDMNVGVFFQVLAGAWFGDSSARETLLSALEHPPTWLAILLAAATDRSYKKTGIAMLYEREKPAAQKQFLHSLIGLLSNEDLKRVRDEQAYGVAVTQADL